MAQENRAGMVETRQQPLGFGRRDVQMLGCDQVGDRNRLVLVACQNECPESFQTVASQVAPAQSRQLILERPRTLDRASGFPR